ncbi:MAG: hypothetical protein OEY45_12570, partial [Gammaproteobacteria bacterium]|nr:hypothetical protein [Gammaproteobacteria bacterium]
TTQLLAACAAGASQKSRHAMSHGCRVTREAMLIMSGRVSSAFPSCRLLAGRILCYSGSCCLIFACKRIQKSNTLHMDHCYGMKQKIIAHLISLAGRMKDCRLVIF